MKVSNRDLKINGQKRWRKSPPLAIRELVPRDAPRRKLREVPWNTIPKAQSEKPGLRRVAGPCARRWFEWVGDYEGAKAFLYQCGPPRPICNPLTKVAKVYYTLKIAGKEIASFTDPFEAQTMLYTLREYGNIKTAELEGYSIP